MSDLIKNEFQEAANTLAAFMADESNFTRIAQAGQIMVDSLNEGGKIISCGNGGSMSDAMHFAEEMTGRFRDDREALPAIGISDPAFITCSANDFGFEKIFSSFVEAHGKRGDVLLAISTSGNSANVIEAAKAAQTKGMKVIGLTGKNGGQLAALCEVEIRAPHSKYADRAQEIHIKIIHALIHFVEEKLLND